MVKKKKPRHARLLSSLLLGGVLLAAFLLPNYLLQVETHEGNGIASEYLADERFNATVKTLLHKTLNETDAEQGCVLVIDSQSGSIKSAVDTGNGNGPNMCLSSVWEPGSVMKPLLIAAAIDTEAIDPDTTTFFDSNSLTIEGYMITNAEPEKSSTISIQDVITKSINVGAVSTLKEMGEDQTTIDLIARKTYYDYLTNHFGFGDRVGYVPDPRPRAGIEVTYANMAIGQSMTATPVQLASAYAAVLNGGTYYEPRLGEAHKELARAGVVRPETSKTMRQMLITAFAANTPQHQRAGFELGGKTGTAHAASPTGEYIPTDADNGTYVGFISKAGNEYVMLVRIDGPKTNTFASAVARELWLKIVTTMIDETGSLIAG